MISPYAAVTGAWLDKARPGKYQPVIFFHQVKARPGRYKPRNR